MGKYAYLQGSGSSPQVGARMSSDAWLGRPRRGRRSARLRSAGRARGVKRLSAAITYGSSASSDEQDVESTNTRHRRRSGAVGIMAGDSGLAKTLAPSRTTPERIGSKLSIDSRPPPYLTLPYLPRVPMSMHLGVPCRAIARKTVRFLAGAVSYTHLRAHET